MSTEDTKPFVLVVDDDKNTRDGLQRALRRQYEVLVAESGERALELLDAQDIDVVLSDVRMPGMDGITLLQRVLARYPGTICILLTAYGNVETAVEAMKRGAYDFLMKPVNLDHLDLLLQRALRSRDVESENLNLREQLDRKYGLDNLIGASDAMQAVFDTIQQAAPTQATVLIQGESGTGKELVAHAIHRLSSRSNGPFVAVHCAALSQNLLESELFGHEKGAFTGAANRRKGRFELADGGTLFLDEVSEIDTAVQVKLLRVLEEHAFERVGGADTLDVDIRLITATNRDLRQLAEEGKFREDLFFRLDVITIHLPPLRERPGDVPLLCDHFLKECAAKNGKELDGFTQDAINMLAAYQWPGNVRELRNTIEKMVVLARGSRLTARDVPGNIREEVRGRLPVARAAGDRASQDDGLSVLGADSLADAERQMIEAALSKHGGNRTKAAEDLGISRRTLHRKLKQYREDVGADAGEEESETDGN